MQFTSQQRKAIAHSSGQLQLIACAGSGKTEVISRRAARLLRTSHRGKTLVPANIVAFTFTEKAAGELKARIYERCREDNGAVVGLAEMYVGTIHGFCLDLLRNEVPKFLKYEVMNAVQQLLFIDRHSRRSGLTDCIDLSGEPLRRYIDTKLYKDGLDILREAKLVPQRLKNCSLPAALAQYESLLHERGYFDYTSILKEAVLAIKTDQALRARLAARIRHVIVDEYQDVNPIQEELVAAMHALGAQVCVVGDDDQTIYQWRGSHVQNILTFGQRYPAVLPLALEDNFRSSEGIVETARQFIEQNGERLPKAMQPTGAQPYERGDIVVKGFSDQQEEARYIARTCQALHGVAIVENKEKRGLAWSDMAVLLRSVSASGAPITRAFDDAGIPYLVVGMNHLFRTPEAEAARHLFYFMAGAVSFAEALAAWEQANTGAKTSALRAALQAAQKASHAMRDAHYKRSRVYSLQRQFLAFLETAGIREECVPGGRGEILMYNLGKFSQVISDFEIIHFHSDAAQKYESFAKFLQYGAENAYPEGKQDNAYANPDAVRIMTVHQSKGMEWPAVFIPQLDRNRFPSKRPGGRSVWHLLPRDSVRDQVRYEGSIEDERRLFYVAMTRSQKFLHLTWAPVVGNRLYQQPSEFWNDLRLGNYVSLREKTYADRARCTPQPKATVANVTLTFSDIKYYFQCPYQFKLRILYGFNPPIDEALGYGKSLHDALAEVHGRALAGERISEQEAPKLVKRHLRLPYAYPSLEETLTRSAEAVLRDYIRKNQDLFPNLEFSEKNIEVTLSNGVSVVGRIDLVRRLDTNETSIVDLKSSQRVQSEDVNAIQLNTYVLGYRELTGRDADFVEIYDLEQGQRNLRSVDGRVVDTVRKKVLKVADALRTNRLPATPAAKKCAGCDFHHMCSAAIPLVVDTNKGQVMHR